ncbi:serine hydrolase FSH [Xylariales sp. PMI_506]|nr:serine hydrolase FSH [Xylariales sp. PMI_506]
MASKPKVLCLHGEGCSGLILRAQMRLLYAELESEFDFVFVDGPFSAPAGPGVLPFFEGPYYTWIPESGNESEAEELNHVWDSLEEQIQEEGPFLGILGFSMGSRVATGLLQRQEKLRLEASHDILDGSNEDQHRFGFALYFCGCCPPLLQRPEDDSAGGMTNGESRVAIAAAQENLPRVPTPTLHVLMSKDKLRASGETLVETFYDPKTSTVLNFAGDHHFPTARGDLDAVLAAVRKLHTAAEMAAWDIY